MSVTDLVRIEKELAPYRPMLEEVLAPYPLKAPRLIHSVALAYQNTPKLAECAFQDVVNCAQTAAYLGLTVDGVTGQAYILPFNDRRSGRMRAQLIPGYKGYVTIAAYGRMSVDGMVVRQGEEFKVVRGTQQNLIHIPEQGHEDKRPIVAAWAVARSFDRPPIISVLSMDQIIAIRDRSQGFKSGSNSPWKTDFSSMAIKSAVRGLAKFLPLSPVMMAAQMEMLHEYHGVPVHITPDASLVVDERVESFASAVEVELPTEPPPLLIQKEHSTVSCRGVGDWRAKMLLAVDSLSPSALARFAELNTACLNEYERGYPGDVAVVRDAIKKKLNDQNSF